jgi:hypothetical protein
MRVTEANREGVYRVPLFIKAPGQTTGEIDDTSAQNLDVLPSIVDLVGADVDWEFDGHSLFDGSTAHTAPKVSTGVDAAFAIAERRADDFPGGDGWAALAAVGEHADLVGTAVDEPSLGQPSRLRVELAQADELAELPTDDGELPFVLAGTVTGTSSEPPELLVAVNGTVAGVAGGYEPDGDGWTFGAFVGDVFRDGANDVALYEVAADGVTLRPLA